MNIEVKKYLPIGGLRLVNIKVFKILEDDLKNNNLEKSELLFEGYVKEVPQNIQDMYYYKIQLGNPTVLYVCE